MDNAMYVFAEPRVEKMDSRTGGTLEAPRFSSLEIDAASCPVK